jgi:hypothetical protein
MTDMTPVLGTPSAIRDHLRHAIEPAGFAANGVRFVLCDGDNGVLAHCHVGQVPPDVDLADCVRTVSDVVRAVARGTPGGGVLVALTRPGRPIFVPTDRHWFRAARSTCAEHAVRLLGVHVVTPRGQRELVLDDAL